MNPASPTVSPVQAGVAAAVAGAPDAAVSALDALSQHLFKVVPASLRTHCTLTARVASSVLRQLGIQAVLQPCQMVYADATRNIVIGFTGAPMPPGQWDGHVVCLADGHLVDAATFAFEERFGVAVPHVVVVPQVQGLNTHVIARVNLARGSNIWWLAPPPGAQLEIPAEPDDLVEGYARRLLKALA